MRVMHARGKRRTRIALLLIVGMISAAIPLQPLFADADGEREALARISHELEALEPLIRQAEAQSDPDARIRFRYDWLRQDLSRMKQGIEDHVAAPRAEPRTFPPLRGDYRR